MLNTNLLLSNTRVKNIHIDYVLTYMETISVANQPVYIFKDKNGKEVRLNKPSLTNNYELLDIGLVQQ